MGYILWGHTESDTAEQAHAQDGGNNNGQVARGQILH